MHYLRKTMAFAVGVAFLTAAAHANPRDEARNQVVSYADLDLTKPDGMETLKARLKAAAARVCGPDPDMHNPDAWAAYRYCKTRAFYNALATVNAQIASVQKERVAQGR